MGNEPSIKLLLLEDCDVDAMFVRRLLESSPSGRFRIDRATHLEDGLAMMQASDYDVALLDLSLPDASGLEAFEQIRAVDARLPVVVFTGNEDEELALVAIESGVQDFMAKGHVTGQMLFRSLRFAIARQRKMLGFQAAADTDPLTGMANRRHLESKFQSALAASASDRAPMAVCLLDLDHFKEINDRHGHLIGDAVLKRFAEMLTEALPPEVSAARIGGEEFALLMPGFSLAAANDIVDGLLQRLAESALQFDGFRVQLTASAGVVAAGPEDAWETSFRAADVALYRAKKGGRNRVCQGEIEQ